MLDLDRLLDQIEKQPRKLLSGRDIAYLLKELQRTRADLEAARSEIAEARRQLFKMPVTYGNAAETLGAMVVEAQHELARRTLALNEARAELEQERLEKHQERVDFASALEQAQVRIAALERQARESLEVADDAVQYMPEYLAQKWDYPNTLRQLHAALDAADAAKDSEH